MTSDAATEAELPRLDYAGPSAAWARPFQARYRARWAAVITLAAMVLGVTCTLLATRWGSGMAGDGHAYVASARNVLRGNWVTFEDYSLAADPKPLEQFPPGYPLLLAAGGLVGLDPILFSRVLNVGFLLVSLGLGGWLLWTHTRSLLALAAGLFVFALSPTTLFAHSNILSEAAYVACVAVLLSGLIGAYRNLDRKWLRTALLCVAAVAAGWSCTLRYAGIFLIFVGVASVLLWPSPASGFKLTPVRRLTAATAFGLVAVLFPVAVATFNLWLLGRPTSRPLAFHPPDWDQFAQLFDTVGYWLQPAYSWPMMTPLRQWAGAAALLLLTLAPPAWLAVRLARRRSIRLARPGAWATTLFLFAGGYTPFIVTAFTFQDAGIPFNKRIFMPLWFAGWVFAVGVIGRAVASRRWPVSLRAAAVAAVLAVLTCNLLGEFFTVRGRNNIGWGFEGPRWRDNRILQTIRADHGSVAGHPLASNAGDLIGLATDYRSAHVPKWFSRPRGRAYAGMPDRLRQFGRWAMANDARVIYFNDRDSSDYLATEDMLRDVLHLRVLVQKSSGTIYQVEAIKGLEDEDYDGDGRPDWTNLPEADQAAVRAELGNPERKRPDATRRQRADADDGLRDDAP